MHSAAALPLYPPADIYTTDVDGTRIVLEAAHAHGVERVVHISSTAVYGIPDHHPLLEDDRLHGVGPYGEAKVEAERSLPASTATRGHVRAHPAAQVVRRARSASGVFALLYDWAQRRAATSR